MADINVVGLIAIIIFYIAVLGVGVWAARRRKQTEEETMLAGRSIGLVLGTFTMTATWVGGGYINGTAEAVYDKDLGLVWTQAPWAYALSLTVGGFVFAKIMRNKGYFTVYDPLQERYGPLMGGLLYIPDLFGLLLYQGAILSALGSSISVIINLSRVPSIIASSCIAVLYTLLGGLYSVTYTDVVQVILIFVGLWLSIPFAMTHPAVSSISENSSEVWIGELPINLIGVWIDYALLMIFGGVPVQAYFQRVLSCITARKAQGLSLGASIGCIVLAIPPALIGAIGASTDWKKTDFFKPSSNSTNQTVTFDKALVLPMVLQYLCPPVVSAIGLGAVTAAIMSSTDSVILSAGTIFARNVYKHIFRPKASEREVLWVMRIFMLGLGVASTAVALMADSIYTLMVLTVDLIYVILFPQFVCAIYIPHVNTYGSIMGYIMGLILRLGGGESTIDFPAAIKYPLYDEELQMQLFPFRTFAMIVSFATVVFVSYLTKYLFSREILPAKYDFLQYFELKQYELDKTHATGYQDGHLEKHEKYHESKL